MTTTQIQLPDKVRQYALVLSSPQYQTDPQDYNLREMWLDINANPYYSPTGLDWAEVIADWESTYVYSPEQTVNEIIDSVRSLALTYLNQWETGECAVCGAGGWVNTLGKCSDCE